MLKKSINYNGTSQKRSFHKIKKHVDILGKRLSFKKQVSEIERLDNDLLNIVLKAIVTIKSAQFSEEDEKVFKEVDLYRSSLLSDTSEISYEVFSSNAKRQVKDICRISASPKVWGQFLYFITKFAESKEALEIGTNVGISGAYILNGMKKNSRDFNFISMEGLSQLCELCHNHFSKITSEKNFDIISGLYDDTFPKLINKQPKFDFLFIDGNHQKEPTLIYFEELKKCMNDRAIFIFDDIYYNTDMTEAWNIIKKDDRVNFSIDMYKWGIAIIDDSESVKNKSFGLHLSYD